MTTRDQDLCFFCGESAFVDVLEYWAEDRSFQLDTCCEAMHDHAVRVLPLMERRELNAWFLASTGCQIRQIITSDECPSWTVDPGLTLCDVEWAVAREFVRTHHRHNAPPPGWKFGAGLTSGSELVAVMMAGRPVAPNIDHRTVIEITRVCVKDLSAAAGLLGLLGFPEVYWGCIDWDLLRPDALRSDRVASIAAMRLSRD